MRANDAIFSALPAPTLDLNFPMCGEVLDARFVCTRAGTATLVNSAGVIVAASANTPRFDYAAGVGECRLLIENSATNRLLNSDILGDNIATQSVTLTSGDYYILSFYGTGSVHISGGALNVTLTGTGAYPNRVSVQFAAAATTAFTVTGNVYFAQLEGGFTTVSTALAPTSFIPTAGAAVTRASDVIVATASATPLDWFNVNEGTFLIEATPQAMLSQSQTAGCAFVVSQATQANMLQALLGMPNGYLGFKLTTNSVVVSSQITSITAAINNLQKVFASYQGPVGASATKGTAMSVYFDGVAANTVLPQISFAHGVLSGVPTQASIGGGGLVSPANIWVRRIRYWPKRLADGYGAVLTLPT